jgi:hypothetical protein
MIYEFEKLVNFEKLNSEIKASSLGSFFEGLITSGASLKVVMNAELSTAQQAILSGIIEAHSNSPSVAQIVRAKREESQAFGKAIFDQFIEENIALGITQLGLTSHVRKVCREVSDAVLSGSLYDAIEEISKLDPTVLDPIILSAPRLLYFRNKIENYLQVPNATTWNQSKTW